MSKSPLPEKLRTTTRVPHYSYRTDTHVLNRGGNAVMSPLDRERSA